MKQFFGDVPEYAILSHTWGEDEVSYQDWQAVMTLPDLVAACKSTGATTLDAYTTLQQRRVQAVMVKSGYHKITDFCYAVLQSHNHLGWAWVDTCCIDKSSSSELSEAINSMFNWYRRSSICIAYLSDVPGGENTQSTDSAFRRSKWFTQGWTLQELLAPLVLDFYSSDWCRIDSRVSETPLYVVSEITGIRRHYPKGNASLQEASISERMSWAARRKTTRPEDIAYCLLGIFDVHIPMLYGEGEHAFIRLQEEIIKKSTDQTIFAWGLGMPVGPCEGQSTGFHQLLAPSPGWFAYGAELQPLGDMDDMHNTDKALLHAPFQLTNAGLAIQLSLHRFQRTSSLGIYLAALHCFSRSPRYRVGVYVKIPGNEATTEPPSVADGTRVVRVRTSPPVLIDIDGIGCEPVLGRSASISRHATVAERRKWKPRSIILPEHILSPQGGVWRLFEVFPPAFAITQEFGSGRCVITYDQPPLRGEHRGRGRPYWGEIVCFVRYSGPDELEFTLGIRIPTDLGRSSTNIAWLFALFERPNSPDLVRAPKYLSLQSYLHSVVRDIWKQEWPQYILLAGNVEEPTPVQIEVNGRYLSDGGLQDPLDITIYIS